MEILHGHRCQVSLIVGNSTIKIEKFHDESGFILHKILVSLFFCVTKDINRSSI